MRTKLWITVGLITLLSIDIALAEEVPPEVQFTPYNCEKWEARKEAMADSSDPLQQSLGELLQQPELSYCQTRRVRVQDPEKPDEPWFDWDPNLDWLAMLMQILAIAVLIALVIWLLLKLQPGRWAKASSEAQGKTIPVDQRRTLATADDDDLDQVVSAAERAWAAGDRRRALSLLYRGALIRIWPRDRDRRARTEREVLAALRSQRAPEQLQSTMRLLTRAWQQSAWAHRPPSDQDFSKVRDRWIETFDDSPVLEA
ncbi:MAG: DUF4129 domain-containing protein [Pseudomonadota bacterium]